MSFSQSLETFLPPNPLHTVSTYPFVPFIASGLDSCVMQMFPIAVPSALMRHPSLRGMTAYIDDMQSGGSSVESTYVGRWLLLSYSTFN
jgi:hypothetical protein